MYLRTSDDPYDSFGQVAATAPVRPSSRSRRHGNTAGSSSMQHSHQQRQRDRGHKSRRKDSFSSLSPPPSPPCSPPLSSMMRHPTDYEQRQRHRAKMNGLFPKSRFVYRQT